MKRVIAGVLLAVTVPVMAMAEIEALDWSKLSTGSWPECGTGCAIDTINAAQSVVIFHTRGELTKPEAEALVAAVQRGARVSVFVGQENSLSKEVIWYVQDIYQKWAATAPDEDTSMLGMGGCVMGATDAPAFIVTDPFGTKPNDAPALVVDGKKTGEISIAAEASVVSETEDFIQCYLHAK